MKTSYPIILSMLALFATSCGRDEKKQMAETTAIPVKVSPLNGMGQEPFLTASGTIQAVHSATLSTRLMGYVTRFPVNVGDQVKKGQLLVAINNADLDAKRSQVHAGIMEATAAFTNAEKDYNRFKNLFADASASQKELDDNTAHYTMAKARLEAAKQMKNEVDAQFAYVNIRAPFDGVITGKFIQNGDMATPGMPLVGLETPTAFEVMASVPESEISKITVGIPVRVLVKSLNLDISGLVTEVSSSAKNTGGQYIVKVALDKTEVPVFSGMFVTVQFPIETAQKSQMVLLPQRALVSNGQLSGVYTVSESNRALLRWLRLGRTFGDQVEVLSGLSTNETIIVSSDGRLYNGVKVSIQ